MGLKNNKKAIFFIIIAIAMLSLFIIVYTTYSVVNDRKSIDERIDTMNNFVFSLEKDISRQVYISGYRAILSIQSYITGQGSFISNSKESIKEALLNGTIDNLPANLMEGYKISDWNSRVSELADKVNLIANYSLIDININQDDPWNIKVEITINLSVQDKANLASWNKIENISTKIEITGFEDPLYLVNTNGHIVNKIKKSNLIFSADVTNLILHVQNSSYISSTTAPSFLDRLEGKTSANLQGIESLVYLPKLSEQGLSIKDKSVVDYIYFSTSNPSARNIQGMPSWFRLDDAHLSVYHASAS